MNPEIHSIVEDMKTRCKKDPRNNPSDINNYQLAQMAYLLSLLAEESEKSTIKTEKATKWLVRLTVVIAILTAVLALTVFFEFPKILVHFNQKPYFSIQTTEKNNQNNPSQNKDKLPLVGEVIPYAKVKE